MKIAGATSDVRDLTRWNRAGLSRFRYVEGGAAEWLEYLRVAHLLLYATDVGAAGSDDPDDWREGFETGVMPESGQAIEEAVAAIRSTFRAPPPWAFVEDGRDYRAALLAQYDRIPLAQTAQISRAFARAFHILTETLDAYANEGYLATATQAPHLRRLLELIDFEPRLAASALVPIALTILPETRRQTVDRGLSVEYMSTDGSPVLTFESLDAVTVDPGLNLLRPTGWDQRSDPVPASQSKFALTTPGVLTIALTGQMAILEDGGHRQGALVTAASKSAGTITLARGPVGFGGTMQTTEALLAPRVVHAARPRGSTWLHFASTPDVYVGQIVSLSTDPSHTNDLTWNIDFAEIAAGDGFVLSGRGRAPGARAGSIVSNTGNATLDASLTGLELIGDMVGFVFGNTATVLEIRGRDVRISRSVPSNLQHVFPAVRSVIPNDPELPEEDQVPILGPYITPQDAEPVGDLVLLAADRIYVDTGLPEGVGNGMAVAFKFKDGKVGAATIQSVIKDENDGYSFIATLPSGYDPDDVVEIATDFSAESGLLHEIRSSEALFTEGLGGALDVTVDAVYDPVMKPGRLLLVAPDPATAGPDDAGKGLALTIATANRTGGTLRLTFEEDLTALDGFQRGHSVVYGNVALFGHGKSLPEKVLGSGDGSIAEQVMELPAPDIATRPDPSFPGGTVPDIEIKASGRKLRLVARSEEAEPLQPAYTIRLAEDGSAEAVFLSRLPTEPDGVRLTRFRQGAGQIGNTVPPFAIVKPTPKNPIIGAMIQPFSPQFGADVEGAETLKSQGASYFSLMNRALSARDFARLAESTTNVWHAHAHLVREAGSRGRPTIILTVVPSGGGAVAPIRNDLAEFLLTRALPGTTLDIRDYRPVPVTGSATVNLKAGYAQDVTITEEIQTALYSAFSLQARALGRTLFVTELAAVIEAHEAVQNLVFRLTPAWGATDPPRVVTSASGAIQAVMPAATQTVFIESPKDIEILWGPGGAP